MEETTQRKTIMKLREKSRKRSKQEQQASDSSKRIKQEQRRYFRTKQLNRIANDKRKIDEYVEMKMIKGHSKEDAERMAKEQITTRQL